MGVHIVHSLEELERDLKIIATTFKPRMAEVVQDTAREGNNAAKANARGTSGKHARKYAGSFSAERRAPLTYEWGPRASGQGELVHVLERGSRNNPGHHDIAKAADRYGAGYLSRRADFVLDRLFWP